MVAKTKGGADWVQEYVVSLNKETCIACGRCYKSCPKEVMTLTEEEDDEGEEHKFMILVKEAECIGCKVCSKVCSKGCFTHAA